VETASQPTTEPVAPVAKTPHSSIDEVLTPKLGSHWAINGWQLAIVAGFCLLFMHYNYMPLFHSDVWGHIAYGNWILDHGRLPVEEPFVVLAQGVPLVDTAWLGQVILAAAGRLGDAEWYTHLFALTMLATYLVLARTFYLQTRRAGVAIMAAALVFIVGWSRHAIIRPEIFGSLCFATLLWFVARSDGDRLRLRGENDAELHQRWLVWLGVPLLFALWANLHGSYIVGFAVLGCYAAGTAFEALWATRSLKGLLADRRFRRWTLLTELAVLGAMVNPYGIDLLLNTILFPSHPNLKDIIEWFPLEMVSLEGIPMGFSWVLLLVVLRHSRVRVAPTDVLLLAVFTLAVCLRVRMITWYAPVLLFVLAPHLADVVARVEDSGIFARQRAALSWMAQPSFRLLPIAALFVWITFAFSPISRPVLGGKPRPPERLYSDDTPLGVTEYLREHPPQGLVANPQWWGDWLVWHGPPEMKVLMTTNSVHVVPPQVWRDYLAIANASPGLARRLDRYRINTVIVCKELQTQLEETMRRSSGWDIVFEDEVGLIAVRTPAVSDTEASDNADSSHE